MEQAVKNSNTKRTSVTMYKSTLDLLSEIVKHRVNNMTEDDRYKPNKSSVLDEIIRNEHEYIFGIKNQNGFK